MPTDPEIFASRLEQLFDTQCKSDGSCYTQQEVVDGTGGKLTRVYLWKLRTGRATHPSFQIIQALAQFFQVDLNYFFTDDQQGQPTQPLHDELVNQIARQSARLDREGKQVILQMIEYMLKAASDKSR